MIACWKCRRPIDEKKVRYRTACFHCGTEQHACLNCKNYAPGKPNDCSIPGTDWIRDREKGNLCEEFSCAPFPPVSKTAEEKERFNRLFKD